MDFEIKSELMIIIILHDINSLLIDSKMEIEARKKKSFLIEMLHIKILSELPSGSFYYCWKVLSFAWEELKVIHFCLSGSSVLVASEGADDEEYRLP